MGDRLAHLLAHLGSSLGGLGVLLLGAEQNREQTNGPPRAKSQRIRRPGARLGRGVHNSSKLYQVRPASGASEGSPGARGRTEEWKA